MSSLMTGANTFARIRAIQSNRGSRNTPFNWPRKTWQGSVVMVGVVLLLGESEGSVTKSATCPASVVPAVRRTEMCPGQRYGLTSSPLRRRTVRERNVRLRAKTSEVRDSKCPARKRNQYLRPGSGLGRHEPRIGTGQAVSDLRETIGIS